jgi:hypothetical protein
MNRATSGRCCPSVKKVALQLYAIFILRPECPDHEVWSPDGWTYSARLAFSRIASGRKSHVVRTVTTVFSYLCLEINLLTCRTLKGVWTCCWDVWTDATKRSSKLLDTEGRSNGKISSSGRMMLWEITVQTEFHVVRMDARELNYTVLNLVQSLLEAHN